MSDDDCAVFFDNVELPPISLEQRASAIAAELRKGSPSKRFCRLLASVIDGEKNATQFRMELGRKRRGQPARPNVELGKAMIAGTAGKQRGHLKKVKQDIAAQFGVTVRTAESAMQDELSFEKLRRTVDEGEGDCVPWPSGLEDDIKRKEMPE